MMALSIRQPWALSIVEGTKRVENRKWTTNFRGRFAIHAAKGLTYDELDGWAHMIKAEGLVWEGLRGRTFLPRDFLRGGIVGTARLSGVVSDREALPPDQRPWFFGPFGFCLEDVRPTPFIECSGRLGFFKIDQAIEHQIGLIG